MTTSIPHRDSYRHIATPALFVILWSTGFIGGKFGLPYAEPFTFLLWRYLIVTLLFLILALLARAPWPATPRQVFHIIISGVLVNSVFVGGVFSSLNQGVPSGIVSLIVGLQPLFTAVVAGRLLGETISGRQWFGFVLGLLGVLLVLLDKISFTAGGPAGILMSVLALAGITAGTLYQKRFCTSMDMRSGGVIQFGASMLIMALVQSLGAISLLHVIIKRGEASRVVSLFYLVPPVTALLAFLLFGERLGTTALSGMFVTVTGVALAIRR